MEPPICAVCDEYFDPSQGARVAFSPGEDWFCSEHLPEARTLSDHGLGDAVVSIRLGESATLGERHGPGLPRLVYVPCRPVPVAVLADVLVADLADLLGAIGLDAPSDVTDRTTRRWDPVDGARPPHCPYGDQHVVTAVSGDRELTIRHSSAWWNPDTLANATITVAVDDRDRDGRRPLVRVGASTPNPADPDGTVDALDTVLPITPPNAAMIRYVLDLTGRR